MKRGMIASLVAFLSVTVSGLSSYTVFSFKNQTPIQSVVDDNEPVIEEDEPDTSKSKFLNRLMKSSLTVDTLALTVKDLNKKDLMIKYSGAIDYDATSIGKDLQILLGSGDVNVKYGEIDESLSFVYPGGKELYFTYRDNDLVINKNSINNILDLFKFFNVEIPSLEFDESTLMETFQEYIDSMEEIRLNAGYQYILNIEDVGKILIETYNNHYIKRIYTPETIKVNDIELMLYLEGEARPLFEGSDVNTEFNKDSVSIENLPGIVRGIYDLIDEKRVTADFNVSINSLNDSHKDIDLNGDLDLDFEKNGEVNFKEGYYELNLKEGGTLLGNPQKNTLNAYYSGRSNYLYFNLNDDFKGKLDLVKTSDVFSSISSLSDSNTLTSFSNLGDIFKDSLMEEIIKGNYEKALDLICTLNVEKNSLGVSLFSSAFNLYNNKEEYLIGVNVEYDLGSIKSISISNLIINNEKIDFKIDLKPIDDYKSSFTNLSEFADYTSTLAMLPSLMKITDKKVFSFGFDFIFTEDKGASESSFVSAVNMLKPLDNGEDDKNSESLRLKGNLNIDISNLDFTNLDSLSFEEIINKIEILVDAKINETSVKLYVDDGETAFLGYGESNLSFNKKNISSVINSVASDEGSSLEGDMAQLDSVFAKLNPLIDKIEKEISNIEKLDFTSLSNLISVKVDEEKNETTLGLSLADNVSTAIVLDTSKDRKDKELIKSVEIEPFNFSGVDQTIILSAKVDNIIALEDNKDEKAIKDTSSFSNISEGGETSESINIEEFVNMVTAATDPKVSEDETVTDTFTNIDKLLDAFTGNSDSESEESNKIEFDYEALNLSLSAKLTDLNSNEAINLSGDVDYNVNDGTYFGKIIVDQIPGLDKSIYNHVIEFDYYKNGSTYSLDDNQTSRNDYTLLAKYYQSGNQNNPMRITMNRNALDDIIGSLNDLPAGNVLENLMDRMEGFTIPEELNSLIEGKINVLKLANILTKNKAIKSFDYNESENEKIITVTAVLSLFGLGSDEEDFTVSIILSDNTISSIILDIDNLEGYKIENLVIKNNYKEEAKLYSSANRLSNTEPLNSVTYFDFNTIQALAKIGINTTQSSFYNLKGTFDVTVPEIMHGTIADWAGYQQQDMHFDLTFKIKVINDGVNKGKVNGYISLYDKNVENLTSSSWTLWASSGDWERKGYKDRKIEFYIDETDDAIIHRQIRTYQERRDCYNASNKWWKVDYRWRDWYVEVNQVEHEVFRVTQDEITTNMLYYLAKYTLDINNNLYSQIESGVDGSSSSDSEVLKVQYENVIYNYVYDEANKKFILGIDLTKLMDLSSATDGWINADKIDVSLFHRTENEEEILDRLYLSGSRVIYVDSDFLDFLAGGLDVGVSLDVTNITNDSSFNEYQNFFDYLVTKNISWSEEDILNKNNYYWYKNDGPTSSRKYNWIDQVYLN